MAVLLGSALLYFDSQAQLPNRLKKNKFVILITIIMVLIFALNDLASIINV